MAEMPSPFDAGAEDSIRERRRLAWANGEGLGAVIARVAHKQHGQENPGNYRFALRFLKCGISTVI